MGVIIAGPFRHRHGGASPAAVSSKPTGRQGTTQFMLRMETSPSTVEEIAEWCEEHGSKLVRGDRITVETLEPVDFYREFAFAVALITPMEGAIR